MNIWPALASWRMVGLPTPWALGFQSTWGLEWIVLMPWFLPPQLQVHLAWMLPMQGSLHSSSLATCDGVNFLLTWPPAVLRSRLHGAP